MQGEEQAAAKAMARNKCKTKEEQEKKHNVKKTKKNTY